MTEAWIKVLRILDRKVDAFVQRTGNDAADKYQLKINVWKSASRRSLVGILRHLPSKGTVDVEIRLPI